MWVDEGDKMLKLYRHNESKPETTVVTLSQHVSEMPASVLSTIKNYKMGKMLGNQNTT